MGRFLFRCNFFLALLLLFSSSLLANTRFQSTTADDMLATSERPAVLALQRMFLGSETVQLRVTYFPLSGKKIDRGYLELPLSQGFMDELLTKSMPYYMPTRYDRLLAREGGLSLQTATQSVDWEGALAPLPSQLVDKNTFANVAGSYLNRELVPPLVSMLNDFAEVRYREMNARERGTFMTERARQVGMPVEVLESLVSSGYAFAFHVPQVRAQLTIRARRVERENAPDYTVFDHALSASHSLGVQVLVFDGKSFEEFALLESTPGRGISSGRVSIRGLSSPMNQRNSAELTGWMETAVTRHFDQHQVGINYQLKHYEDFRIQAPLRDGSLTQFELAVGNQEAIRVDQPFIFYRQVDGQRQEQGWGQVVEVGQSCQVLPVSERTPTHLANVAGAGEAFDLAIEHPWTGVKTYARGSYQLNDLDLGWGSTGGGELGLIEVGVAGNLGYLFNSPGWSEIWLKTGFGGGLAPGGDYQRFDNASFGDGFAFRLHLGMEKRWLLGAGWFLGAGADMGFEARTHRATGTGWNDESFSVDLDGENFGVSSLYILPEVTLHQQLSPNSRLRFSVGYHLPFRTQAVWSDEDIRDIDGIDDYYFSNTELEPGLAVSLEFSWLLNTGGGFATWMSEPDDSCQVLGGSAK